MAPLNTLISAAEAMRRSAGSAKIPSLYAFTDPARGMPPLQAAARLPRGAALVYRHFGAADRRELANALRTVCRRRGVLLLIGADPMLAREVGADGVHWPERLTTRRRPEFRLQTAAAHGAPGLRRARRAGMDAAILSPVFPSDSPSAGVPLGSRRAGMLVRSADLPVIALGGVSAERVRQLKLLGFSGIALVSGLT